MSGLKRQFARRQAMRIAETNPVNSADKKLQFKGEWDRIKLNWLKAKQLVRAKKRQRIKRIQDGLAKLMAS